MYRVFSCKEPDVDSSGYSQVSSDKPARSSSKIVPSEMEPLPPSPSFFILTFCRENLPEDPISLRLLDGFPAFHPSQAVARSTLCTTTRVLGAHSFRGVQLVKTNTKQGSKGYSTPIFEGKNCKLLCGWTKPTTTKRRQSGK